MLILAGLGTLFLFLALGIASLTHTMRGINRAGCLWVIGAVLVILALLAMGAR